MRMGGGVVVIRLDDALDQAVADDIVFIEPTPAGSQSYAVYIRAPSSGWGGTYLPAFDKILPTFQTLPAS